MKSSGTFLPFVLGMAVFTTSPPEYSADFLRIHLFGSYLVTYFDLAVGFSCLYYVLSSGFKFDANERKIYWALSAVVITRIISLVFAHEMVFEQIISVFRYILTFLLVLLLANLLNHATHRRRLLQGIIFGAIIETLGGVYVFFLSGGENRGIWLGLDNYKLQVFVLVFCCLSLYEKKIRTWNVLLGVFLLLGIMVTETRRAIVLFLISMFLLVWTRYRSILKPVLVMLLLGTVATVPLLRLSPGAGQNFSTRVEQLWSGEGTIGYRIVLWEMAAAAYLSHPLTGLGSGGFARQQNTIYFQITDAFAPGYESAYGSLSTHNTVLGVASETGTLGLIAYFFWVFAVVQTVLNAMQLESRYHDTYIIAACVFLLALMTEDWWGQASFMPPSTCLLGLVLGWCRSHRKAHKAYLIQGRAQTGFVRAQTT